MTILLSITVENSFAGLTWFSKQLEVSQIDFGNPVSLEPVYHEQVSDLVL